MNLSEAELNPNIIASLVQIFSSKPNSLICVKKKKALPTAENPGWDLLERAIDLNYPLPSPSL